MAKKDYIPDSAKNVRDWTKNYLDEIDAIATRIAWPAASVTALKARLTHLHDAAQTVLDRQNELDNATGMLAHVKGEEVPEIRLDTNNLKTTRGFNDGDARTLDVSTGTSSFDPAAAKPILTADSKRGLVSLMVKKLGADAVNLYSRLTGDASWKLLVAKRTHFPYEDTSPPATAGQPEEREYQAIAVVGDDEVGDPSDIVSAIFRP